MRYTVEPSIADPLTSGQPLYKGHALAMAPIDITLVLTIMI